MASKFTQKHNKILAEIASKTATVKPFAGDTPSAKAERIRRSTAEGWDAFSYLCQTYFPHIFKLAFSKDHRVMFEETEACEGIIGITGFRGLGKTVEMGVVYPIWKIIKGERYVIHTAADIDLSQERTAFTHWELLNNKRLRVDFPELEPLGDVETDFYLKNRCRIRARSIKQTHRGTINPKTAKKPGLIVCDDIDKEENMGNQTIGRRRMEKITQELAGALAPEGDGKIIWLGNLVHPNYAICLFKQLILSDLRVDNDKEVPEYQTVTKTHQKAILQFSLEKSNGKSAWEEQYPTKSLPGLRAKFGNTGYQREMLGMPVIEGNVFKNHWFTKYKDLPSPEKMKRVWLYADPAWGEKGCYKAIISIGYDGSKFYVIHCWIRQTENTKFFRYYYDAYQELDRTYRVKIRAAQEVNYGQERILADFDRWASEQHLPPISHRIKRINNKENKNLRIERTETLIECAKVLFPEGQDTPTLISQFLTYPDGYVDGPDALAGCLERFREYDIGKGRVRVRRFQF